MKKQGSGKEQKSILYSYQQITIMNMIKSILSLCLLFTFTSMVNAQTATPEELFNSMDVNEDGELTLTEYSAYLAKNLDSGNEAPSESAGYSIIADFKKYDENEDGKIVLKEFKDNFDK